MSKKKICFVAQFPPPIHGLSKAVDTLYNSYLADEFEFEKIDIKDNKKFPVNALKILKSDADLFYFTISQTVGGNLRDLIIFKLIELKRKKCVIHLHGGYYRKLVDNDMPKWQRRANYKAISRLDGAIVLSKSLRSIFKDMLPEEKIFTVANCVDVEFLMTDDEFEVKLNKQRSKRVKNVLYLSNFIKEKGYRAVLELARLEKVRCEKGGERRLQFNFAGAFFDEEEKNYFFGYIKDHCLDEYIVYHGVVSGKEKKELLKHGDIFILLTRYPNEGQPISVLEAMGNGMMVITTDHAGIPDIATKENGIIADEKVDINSLYEQILNIDDITCYLIVNRKKIIDFFSHKTYLNKLNEVLESLLEQGERTIEKEQ